MIGLARFQSCSRAGIATFKFTELVYNKVEVAVSFHTSFNLYSTLSPSLPVPIQLSVYIPKLITT